jgi:hypothetical protein
MTSEERLRELQEYLVLQASIQDCIQMILAENAHADSIMFSQLLRAELSGVMQRIQGTRGLTHQ